MQSIEQLAEISRDAQERIEKIKSAERRADNGKKVGKYFRTRNNYSCPEKPSDYWWVYAKITKMDDAGYLYMTEFQIDKNGDINVRFDHYAYHMQGWTEIKRAEMLKAWKRLDAKLDKLAPI